MARCRSSLLVAIFGVALGALPTSPANAHCDGLDGPVVTAAREALAQDDLLPAIVRPFAEGERRALVGTLDPPAGQYPRHIDDVVLGIAAVHAQRVQLEQFAGVVLVQSAGDPLRDRLAPFG